MTTLISDDTKLRPLVINDSNVLAFLADNIKIWNNVRDLLPHPYTLQDALNFIALCEQENPMMTFAIEYQGELAGVIGLNKQTDVYRLTAELGYWIGEPYWNKGIATKAVNLIVGYGFETLKLVRIYSAVFEFNKASQRVLEKAGFTLDAVLKNAYIKNEVIGNEYMYSLLAD